MERNLQRNGLINLVILLIAGIAAFAVSRAAHLLSGHLSAGFIALGFLAAVVSWFQMRLAEQERLEKLELDELAKTAGRATLFETAEAETFPARRAREQFERFFVPGFAVALGVLQAVGAWWFWRWLQKPTAPAMDQPLVALALLGLLALIFFLIGKYSAGIARLERQPLLRPGANYLLLGAYLLAFTAAGIVAAEAGYPFIDLYLARALCGLLALLAIETLLTLLLEIYRPRLKGKAERVLYEGRLVALLSQPESLFTTAAQALDYQFGFKVSETWFYRFLEKAFAWLLFAQFGILLLSTCFVFIQPGEQALLERFGRPVKGRELLGPGPHVKFFWPVDKVYRYTNEAVQSFFIGFLHEEDGKAAEENTVLWTVKHYKEEFNLLVASRESVDMTNAVAGKKTPPVNLLSVGIPVQYQIRDLKTWAYKHANAADLLEHIGTREVVRYLVSVDLNDMMSIQRFTAAEELRKRIQARADELELGAQILFVGLQDCHPPVAVAKSYEDVVSARQKREANLLAAEAHKIQTNLLAGAQALKEKREAEAERIRITADAKARGALFTNQIPAFNAARSVYTTRAYLQLLARYGANTRKYILTSTNTQDVLLLNLEDKFRPDMLDMPLPTNPKAKK